MPTIRGWAALGVALALFVLWVGFGEELLLAVAAFLLVAVVTAVLIVRRGIPRVAFDRRINPLQLHDGDRAIVEVSVTAGRRLSQAVVEDVVHGLGAARFVADRVEGPSPAVARYEVLCRPRGVYRVGPASVLVRDPLALAESGGPTGRIDRLVVYPAVTELAGLPVVRGQDPTVNTSRAGFSHTGGEDFFTLREYHQGDDLRRVHWPSSAKRDQLMIRQLEMPWQSRALVLLDPRAERYAGRDAFEQAVRGAASAVRHLYRAGFSPTMWAGNPDAITVASAETFASAMEQLAIIETTEHVDLRSVVARMRRSGLAGGVLLLVTGAPDEQDLAVYRMLGRDYLRTVVMSVAHDENEAILKFRRGGVIAMTATPTASWAPIWRQAMEQAWSTATAG
jgi:uncharacterized protein (DUF58 family)